MRKFSRHYCTRYGNKVNFVLYESEISFSTSSKRVHLMIYNCLQLQSLRKPLSTGTKVVSKLMNVVIFSDFIVLIQVEAKNEKKNGIAYVGRECSFHPTGTQK